VAVKTIRMIPIEHQPQHPDVMTMKERRQLQKQEARGKRQELILHVRSDGMKKGIPSWYVLLAQIFHPEQARHEDLDRLI
jgi:hypothetical protein